MSFVHFGLAMGGVGGILIPIVIHLLFRQRRKPIEWGAMRYLIEAFRRARRRMRLEQWILFVVRCLLVLFFGLALGRILFSGSGVGAGGVFGAGGRIIYILIDNGVTSQVLESAAAEAEAGGPQTTALERHKRMAQGVLKSLSPSDRVAVLTMARPSESLIDPPALDHSAVGTVIESIKPTDSPTDLAASFLYLRTSITSLSDNGSPVVVYLLSDFYRGAADLGSPIPESLRNLNRPVSLFATPPASEIVDDVGIVLVEPVRWASMIDASDGSGQLRLRLARYGDLSGAAFSKVRVTARSEHGKDNPGEIVETVVVRWDAGVREVSAEVQLPLSEMEPGQFGVIASIDSDRFASDNARYATLDVRRTLRIGVVARREFGARSDLQNLSPGAWFRRALNPGEGSGIFIDDIDPSVIEPTSLQGVDGVILCRPDLVPDDGWKLLGEYVDRGGLLWLVPSADLSVALWADEAKTALRLPWVWKREIMIASQAGAANGNEMNVDDTGTTPTGESAFRLSEAQPESRLLAMLRGELAELIRPIRIKRYLPIVEGIDPGGVIIKINTLAGARGSNNDEEETAGQQVWMATASPANARGIVIYLASPPDLSWTNLPTKPFMVALVQETIRQGLSLAHRQNEINPGDQPPLDLSASAIFLKRLDDTDKTSGSANEPAGTKVLLRRDGTIRPERAFLQSGLYGAMDRNGTVTELLTANIDSALANIEIQERDNVLTWLGQSGDWKWIDPDDPVAAIRLEESRSELSVVLLIIVLILAAVETILARRFSHAYHQESATGIRVANKDSVGMVSTLVKGRNIRGGGRHE